MPDTKQPVSNADGGMRLDKFLKVSRIIKRRSLANDACDTDHVSLNGKSAKPGARVRVGDVITLRFGDKLTDFEVLSTSEHARREDAAQMYKLVK